MNDAQKEAVMHKDGPCLVLAGPGSDYKKGGIFDKKAWDKSI